MSNIERLTFESWHEFRSDFLRGTFDKRPMRPGAFAFRGQRDADWTLTPAFDRTFSDDRIDKVQFAEEILADFRGMCSLRPELRDIVASSETGALTALAQHFGVPTRLLDWSYSPYVAAFFAFSQLLDTQPEASARVAVWALDLEHPAWSGATGVRIVRLSAADNPRMHSQRGLFTLSTTPFSSLEEYVQHLRGSRALVQATIPATEFRDALIELELMGISWSSLFPGLEGDARQARANALMRLRDTSSEATHLSGAR